MSEISLPGGEAIRAGEPTVDPAELHKLVKAFAEIDWMSQDGRIHQLAQRYRSIDPNVWLEVLAEVARWRASSRTPEWLPIASAPVDGTAVYVYAAEREGLPPFVTVAAYHPDAGWCVDELREVTHWMPRTSTSGNLWASRTPETDTPTSGDAPEKCGAFHHWIDWGAMTCRCGQLAARSSAPTEKTLTLQRYERDVVTHQGGHYGEEQWTTVEIVPCDTGAWVKWSDVAALSVLSPSAQEQEQKAVSESSYYECCQNYGTHKRGCKGLPAPAVSPSTSLEKLIEELAAEFITAVEQDQAIATDMASVESWLLRAAALRHGTDQTPEPREPRKALYHAITMACGVSDRTLEQQRASWLEVAQHAITLALGISE